MRREAWDEKCKVQGARAQDWCGYVMPDTEASERFIDSTVQHSSFRYKNSMLNGSLLNILNG